jgi:hypothetical protein
MAQGTYSYGTKPAAKRRRARMEFKEIPRGRKPYLDPYSSCLYAANVGKEVSPKFAAGV